MPKNNCYISTHDPVLWYIHPEEECKDFFGEDYIEDFGTYIDPTLIRRYKASFRAFMDIQDEIKRAIGEIR